MMIKAIVRFLALMTLVLAAIGAVGCHSPHSQVAPGSPATWTPQEGYQRLVRVGQFAFGGVGVADLPSPGELAFRAIAKAPNAAEMFKSVFTNGTDAARLYALCGLRLKDPAEYNQYAALLAGNRSDVTLISGVVIVHEAMADVAQKISNGRYDPFFPRP